MEKLRRTSKTWVKILIGGIALPFIFFFGYTEFSGGGSLSKGITVNGQEISYAEYDFFYQNQYDRIRKMFQNDSGEIPDFVLQTARNQTQRILVQRAIIAQLSDEIGLQVTDQELASWIIDRFKDENEGFDPIAYKDYLGYFQNKFRLSYEQMLRGDLISGKVQNWLSEIETEASLNDQIQLQEHKWTFEVLNASSKEAADELLESWQKKRRLSKSTLKKYNVEVKKIGPISLIDRKEITPDDLNLEQWKEIFSLTRSNPLVVSPIPSGSRYLLVRYVKKEKVSKKEMLAVPETPNVPDFSSMWISALTRLADIKVHLPN